MSAVLPVNTEFAFLSFEMMSSLVWSLPSSFAIALWVDRSSASDDGMRVSGDAGGRSGAGEEERERVWIIGSAGDLERVRTFFILFSSHDEPPRPNELMVLGDDGMQVTPR